MKFNILWLKSTAQSFVNADIPTTEVLTIDRLNIIVTCKVDSI